MLAPRSREPSGCRPNVCARVLTQDLVRGPSHTWEPVPYTWSLGGWGRPVKGQTG
jgi:hypothetical protein